MENMRATYGGNSHKIPSDPYYIVIKEHEVNAACQLSKYQKNHRRILIFLHRFVKFICLKAEDVVVNCFGMDILQE